MNYTMMPGLKMAYMPKILKATRPDSIISAVCDYFNVSKKEISTKCRKRDIVYPRQMAVYLLCFNTDLSLKAISLLFGESITDHTTVIHSRDKIVSYLTQRLKPFETNFAQDDLNQIQNLISKN